MSHVECVWDEGGRGGALQENKECVTIVQWWICGSEKPKNEARKNGKKFRQYTIEDSMCVCVSVVDTTTLVKPTRSGTREDRNTRQQKYFS